MSTRYRFVVFLFVVVFLAGCSNDPHPPLPSAISSRRKASYDYFGTLCFITVYADFSSDEAKQSLEDAWMEIESTLAGIEDAVSLGGGKADGASDIQRFNDLPGGSVIAVSPITAAIVRKAMEMYRFTGGAFNPAVANLVDLWGFSPRFRTGRGSSMPYDRPVAPGGGYPLPDTRYIEVFRRLADFSQVELGGDERSGYWLAKRARDIPLDGRSWSLKIDLGGIAKGWAADKVGEILKRYGYRYGYVNLGMSSVRLLSRHVSERGAPGKNMWGVSVADPDTGVADFLHIFAKETGVSTSGTYDVHYTVGSTKYSHIIDPATGCPIDNPILSVTVLGTNAAVDDALSTALCVMGPERAEEFMHTGLPGYRVVIIQRTPDGGLALMTNMAARDFAEKDRGRLRPGGMGDSMR